MTTTLADRAVFGVVIPSTNTVMTTRPDHLIIGMSAETFRGGAEGNEQFERLISDLSGVRGLRCPSEGSGRLLEEN